jgi:formylglycine-generating enzyme required for sulfatase activity
VTGCTTPEFPPILRAGVRQSRSLSPEFLARLNALNDGYRYRLPKEAEWEYVARAGSTGPRYADLDAIAWYEHNSGNESLPPGQKQPNNFGLYDMIGSVWECFRFTKMWRNVSGRC